MKKILIYCFSLIVSIIVISCSSSKEIEAIPVEERFARAQALFDDESYLEAIEEFKIITVQYQGSEYADDAQFLIAESRFIRGEYILAASEYDNLIRLMPTSQFTTLCRYKKALSYYNLSPKSQLDQKYSRFALDEFQTYIEYSPKDTMVSDAETKIEELIHKLAQKIFEGGQLYYRVSYYKSAIAYFDKVVTEYRDSKFVDKALLWKARCQKERRDFDGALTTLSELLTKFPETDLRKDISPLQKELEELKAEKLQEQQLLLGNRE